jgi:hypothetical protein
MSITCDEETPKRCSYGRDISVLKKKNACRKNVVLFPVRYLIIGSTVICKLFIKLDLLIQLVYFD